MFLYIGLLLISLNINAQESVSINWPLTSGDAGFLTSPGADVAFAPGRSVSVVTFDQAHGAGSIGWAARERSNDAYYEYRIAPQAGYTFRLVQLNVEISMSRGELKVAAHASTNGYRSPSSPIGLPRLAATTSPRNLSLPADISVSYPDTLSIRIYAWGARDQQVSFYNRHVRLEGLTTVDSTMLANVQPEVTEKREETPPAMTEPGKTPDSLQLAASATQVSDSIDTQALQPATEAWLAEGHKPDTLRNNGNLLMGPKGNITYTTSGTWICPAGVTQVTVECWGGGGGCGTSYTYAGGGAGGGAYASSVLTVVPGNSYSVVVGAGGGISEDGGNSTFGNGPLVKAAGGSSGGDNPGNGGSSTIPFSIGNTRYSGGNGGSRSDPYRAGGGGGGSATSTGNGGNGENASWNTGGTGGLGQGNGGKGGDRYYSGSQGTSPGGGGGGRGSGNNTGSGTGANGQVTITWVDCAVPTKYDVTGGGSYCAGGTGVDIMLSNSETGVDYELWRNGVATGPILSGTTGSPITFTNITLAGNYTIVGTRLVGGCTSTMNGSANITINSLPTATITPGGPTTFCQGGSVVLTASAGSSYAWSTGAATQSITVTTSGSYTVTVTDANGCSATSAPTTVTVNPLPAATITASGPTTFCQGGSVVLTASAGSSYAWSTGAATQSITVTTSGSYTVTVTNANGCSATSAPTTVTVNPLPAATITASGPTTFCQGGSVVLTASAGSSYTWSTGATSPSITVTTSGSYTVTVTNANGCSATSAPTTVTVNPLPAATITASGPTTFCQGASVVLTASAGSSYAWSTGAATQSITVTTSGSYTVTVTNANGCSATSAATNVTVNPAPIATITPSGATTFCQGGSVTLTSSPGSGYLWNTGAVTQSIAVSVSGSYTVTVTGANGCTATSAPVIVTVNPLPLATTGPDQYIFRGQSTPIGAPAITGHTYSWTSAPAGFTSTQANPTVTPMVTTTYTLVETITSTGCTKTNSVTVYVSDRLNISKTTVATPTKPGDLLNYQLTYSNLNTAGAAQNITITDNLPDENLFTYVSSIPAGVYNAAARTLTWTIASLAANTSGTITINGICGRTGTAYGYDPASYYICSGGCSENITNQANIINPESAGVNSSVINQVTQFCDFTLPTDLSGYIKSATPTTIYYVISITNTGNITDKFTFSYNLNQAGSEYIIAIQAQSLSGAPITETPWLEPGEAFTFRLAASIVTGTPPDKHNYSDFLATSYVCNITKTTHIHTITFGGQIPGNGVDMVVTKTASPSPATVGSNMVYTIVVTNIGLDQATEIVVNDVLDPTVTYISSSPPATIFDAATNTITWKSGSLNPNAAPLIFTVTVRPSCSSVPSVLNRAYVSCKLTNQTPEIDPDNNLFLLTTPVNSNITPPAAAGTTICSGTTATLTATGAASGYNYHWYDAATGGTLLHTGNTYTTPALSATTTYYVAIFNSSDPVCESSRTAVTVTVLSAPVITLQPAASSICEGQSTTFTIAAQGQILTYQWEVSTNGGTTWTELTNAGPYSGVLTTTLQITNAPYSLNGNLYRCRVNTGSCALTVYTNPALLTIYPLPVPTISGSTEVCQGSTGNIYTTEAGMSNYNWSISAGGSITSGAGTNAITVTWNTSGNQTVSVGYTNTNGCTTATPTVYNVNVIPSPTALISGTTTVCKGSVPPPVITFTNPQTRPVTVIYNINGGANQNINIPGNNSVTLVCPTNIAGIFNYNLVSAQYQTAPNCPGSITGTATVTVLETATATISGTTTVCQFDAEPTVTIHNPQSLPITVTYSINGTLQAPVNIPAGPSTITFNVSTATAGVFTYKLESVSYQGGTACTVNISAQQAIVTVTERPTATAPSVQSYCEGESTAPISLSGTPSGVVFNITGGILVGLPDQSGVIEIPSFTAVAGSATITITPLANGCTGLPVNFTITVHPLPVVTCPESFTVCAEDSPVTLSGATPVGGTYTGNGVSGGIFNPAIAGIGTHLITYTYTDANPCVNVCEFSITVNPVPVGSATSQTICSGSATSIVLTSTVAGTTYTWTASQLSGATITGFTSCSASCSDIIVQTLTNTSDPDITQPEGGTPGIVRYTITPVANGCTGEPFTVDVTVNPTPPAYEITFHSQQRLYEMTICDGGDVFSQNDLDILYDFPEPLPYPNYPTHPPANLFDNCTIEWQYALSPSGPWFGAVPPGTLTIYYQCILPPPPSPFSPIGDYYFRFVVTNSYGCSSTSNSIVLSVTSTLIMDAGGPDIACTSAAPSPITLTGAFVGGTSTTTRGGTWSIVSGGGTLSNNNFISTETNPNALAQVTYTPAPGFIGTATLMLTSNDPDSYGECLPLHDTREIHIVSGGSFEGCVEPADWLLTNNNANGSLNSANSPCWITLIGGDNSSGETGTTDITNCTGTGNFTFDWSFSAPDDYNEPPVWHTEDQMENYGAGASNGNIVADRPNNISAGDLIIVIIHARDNIGTITPPAGQGFNLIRREASGNNGDNNRGFVQTYWKIATASEPATYTFVAGSMQNNDTWATTTGRVTGYDPTSPIQPIQGNSGVNSGTSYVGYLTIPEISGGVNNRLLVAALSIVDNYPTYINDLDGLSSIYKYKLNLGDDITVAGSIQTIGAGNTGIRRYSWGPYTETAAAQMFTINPKPPVISDDAAYYLIDGVRTFISNTNGTSGTVSVPVNSGSSIGFMVSTESNLDGPGRLSLYNLNVPVPELTAVCPADPNLPACTDAADIQTAYDAWAAGFTFTDGCDFTTTTNIASIPALGNLACGGQLSFTYTVTDNCEQSSSCNSTFTVQNAEELLAFCPTDPELPACSDNATIQTAYNAWVAGFTYSGGCEVTSNLNEIPALTDLRCGGILSFTFTVNDACGQSASCSSTFTVEQAPILSVSCPTDPNLPACTDNATILTAYNNWLAGFTFTGGCNVSTNISSAPALNDLSCGGMLSFTYTATDICGQSFSCSSTFTVQTADILIAVCPGDETQDACQTQDDIDIAFADWIVQFYFTGGCTVTATDLSTLTAPDACGGSISINYTVYDNCGQADNCYASFTVSDTPVDIITCPDPNFVEVDADTGESFASNVPIPTPETPAGCSTITLTWNAPGATPSSGTGPFPATNQFPVGTTTITWTATDGCGNEATCTFTVTVNPNDPPDITCADDITQDAAAGQCSAVVNPTEPTVNAGAPVTWSWTMTGAVTDSGTGEIGDYTFPVGTTTITWTATNASGTDECTQTITIEDNEDPSFTAPGPLSFCVNNIITATYNSSPTPGITPEYDDLTTPRPEYYQFTDGSTLLNLDAVTNLFNDNCCADEDLIIHWRIDFSNTPNPATIAHEDLIWPAIPDQTGQPSEYGPIQFPGDGVNFTIIQHHLYYSLEDCNGQISDEQEVIISISPRPNVMKQ